MTIQERIENSVSHYSIDGRFWSKAEKLENGCWAWTGGKKGTMKYGAFTEPITGRSVNAHRFAWEITFGKIPDGLLVLHRCDNPACVNPEHLKLGTQMDNIHDSIRKKRQHWQK